MSDTPDPLKKDKNSWLFLVKPSGAIAQFLIIIFIGALVYASNAGHLDTLRSFLSDARFAFKVGDYELTIYTLLKGLLIVVLLFWGTAIVSAFGEKRIGKLNQIRRSTQVLLIKIFQIIVYVTAFIIGLDIMGIQLTALTVFGGALGIGIGFGLQKITSNFISGMILLFERTINQDDLVELRDGFSGYVRRINARFTLIETFDGKEIMIPNEDFITSQVVNWTYSNKRSRVTINMGVAYGSDLDQVQRIMLEAANAHPRCLKDPEAVCYLDSFGESSIDFLLYYWIDDVTLGRLEPRSQVMMDIWRRFQATGIEIPFPQRDVHIRSAEGLPSSPSNALDNSNSPAKAGT
ncbi:MAG: mechanosensitive ion channel [Alphaproteobacteria bacterium]|nr:mechanosensitive ion channel [Alphaproteobacteria bacterium]